MWPSFRFSYYAHPDTVWVISEAVLASSYLKINSTIKIHNTESYSGSVASYDTRLRNAMGLKSSGAHMRLGFSWCCFWVCDIRCCWGMTNQCQYIAQIPLGASRHDTFDVSSPSILAVSSLSNSMAWHDELDWLDTSNVSSPCISAVSSVSNSTARHVERVETWRDEPSGIWAYHFI